MIVVKSPTALMAIFIWIGFVCAISFMEAWLKFTAPGVTLPLGLGIGKIVFGALNKVEWVLTFVVFINLFISQKNVFSRKNTAFFIAVAVLLIQTFWLLPLLNTRAQLYIDGITAADSNLHFYYVGVEAVKVISLLVFGISLLKKKFQ
ncbi:MAG: hypothetical protein WCY89_10440 [Flavobacteriaceae bacterium]